MSPLATLELTSPRGGERRRKRRRKGPASMPAAKYRGELHLQIYRSTRRLTGASSWHFVSALPLKPAASRAEEEEEGQRGVGEEKPGGARDLDPTFPKVCVCARETDGMARGRTEGGKVEERERGWNTRVFADKSEMRERRRNIISRRRTRRGI